MNCEISFAISLFVEGIGQKARFASDIVFENPSRTIKNHSSKDNDEWLRYLLMVGGKTDYSMISTIFIYVSVSPNVGRGEFYNKLLENYNKRLYNKLFLLPRHTHDFFNLF